MVDKIISLVAGKLNLLATWDVRLFIKRDFTADGLILVPSDKVLQLHSPIIDCVEIDGELYIL